MRAMQAILVLVVLCAAGLLGAFYWPGASAPRDPGQGSSSPAGPMKQEAALGQFTPLDPPRPAPELGFTSRDGTALRLADFRGRVVLVNLWATWCGPCVREMPSLDRLQAQFGDRLLVLAISEDRGGAHVVDPFLEKLALAHLAIFLDATSAAQQAFKVRGLPTSFLIDRDGRILGSLEGGAEWDAPDMLARLERYLGQGGGAGSGVIKTSTGQ
jgi:thiol-disulfide isomerase/thioredoxin